MLELLIDKDISIGPCKSKSWVSARKEIFHYKSSVPSSCSQHIEHVIPYNTYSYTYSSIHSLSFIFLWFLFYREDANTGLSCGSQSFVKDFRWLSVFMHGSVLSSLTVSICVCCSSQIDWILKGYSPLAGNDVLQYCLMQSYYQFLFLFWSPFWCQGVSFCETSLWARLGIFTV